ncbi:MAG TPA: hypothetical protein VF129_08995 [Actinomycetota bacterium]
MLAAYCPPQYSDMAAAVEAFAQRKFDPTFGVKLETLDRLPGGRRGSTGRWTPTAATPDGSTSTPSWPSTSRTGDPGDASDFVPSMSDLMDSLGLEGAVRAWQPYRKRRA